MKKLISFLGTVLLVANIGVAEAAVKKIILVAGKPSHGPGEHEFRAGCLLLKKCLDRVEGVVAVVYTNGWPQEATAFDQADAIMLFMDGAGGHPAIQGNHLQILGDLMKKGVGLGCYHFGVEVPKDKGGPEFLNWIGGYYEDRFSTNPHWDADIQKLPNHPITRGVSPFKVKDEWYFNIRFRPEMKGVTPILAAKPSDETREGKSSSPRGPYPHVVAASGREEILAWAMEREDGGRGFGFTGGHFHRNFGDDNFRKLVLNSLLWVAKADVPPNGVASRVSEEDLKQNLDPKPPKTQATVSRPSGPDVARADLKNMIVAEGLEVSVFASEPKVKNPTNMDIDERGRVWITEGVNYRSTFQKWGILQPEGDRIVILEDTDGDGFADSEKTFYQGKDINAALGICVLGNRVIVSCSPNIFVLTDTNGDDIADKKEVLFSGIGGVDHDHGAHAFVFGPDGKLYFNFGNEGKQLKTADGQFVVDAAGNEVRSAGKPYRQGMVFRCNPDGTGLETVAWNFRNNYEVNVDSFGTMWQSDNDDDGNKSVRINYVMEFGNFGFTDEMTGASWGDAWKKANLKEKLPESDKPRFHWHMDDPGVVPTLLVTGGGSPTGITVYEGSLLPPIFQNQMIHCDAGPNVVRSYPVVPDGAGYKAGIVDLLRSSDSWFRPSDVGVGPDGSVFVADWNDPGVGGHDMGDRDVATMRGRVYRVAPKGHRISVPKYDWTTAAGLVAALQSPNQATRYQAWTKLNALQGSAETELSKLLASPDQRVRARALQLLARISGQQNKYVDLALGDLNPDIRITGLRIARSLKLDVIPLVTRLTNDVSAAVRRECALALRHQQSPDAPGLWANLASRHDGRDRWYLEALGIGADNQEAKFFAAWLQLVGENWNTPVGRDIIWRMRGNNVPPYLVKIIRDKKISEKERARYLRSLDFIKGPEKEAAVLQLIDIQ